MAATAYTVHPFSGWAWLREKSQDIIIGRCTATPDPDNSSKGGSTELPRGLIKSDIQIISILKGTTNSGTVEVDSQFRPRQGEYYLIFATYNFGYYQALEKYRIVPLGISFLTNYVSGKTLDEQVRSLLRYRVEMLDQQMAEAQEEKKRLEEGLK